MLKYKYHEYLYNDINPIVVNFVKDVLNGKYDLKNWQPEFISRKEFDKRKSEDGYIAYVWSFGNNGKDYYANPIKEKSDRLRFKTSIYGTNIYRIQPIERIHRLQRFYRFLHGRRIEITQGSYENYIYKQGDIVYCDIPYENSVAEKNSKYCGEFDFASFYNWVATRDFPVYFSSYEISDNRFPVCGKKDIKIILSNDITGNTKDRTEYLYTNAIGFGKIEKEEVEQLNFLI